MKLLSIGGAFALVYFVYQMFALSVIGEMMSSKQECDTAILETLKNPNLSPMEADKRLEAGCVRAKVNASIAEKVLGATQ